MPSPASEDYWERDLLGRREDAELLHQFIVRRIAERQKIGRSGSYVLNLDASWGQGKSFFLLGLKDLVERSKHTAVLVNAWEDDYSDDPLLAVVSAIEKAFPQGKSKKLASKLALVGAKIAVTGIKHIARATLSRWAGSDGGEQLTEAADLIKKGAVDTAAELLDSSGAAIAKALLNRFEENKAAIKIFRATLMKLAAESANEKPLFILIDELDRCRPSYSVALLERVKHLFDVDGVAFVIATDTEQLRHSISAIYGAGFDSAGYLVRFFDRTYRLPAAETGAYIKALIAESGLDTSVLSSPPDNDHAAFLAGMHSYFGMNLRELDRCFDVLRSAVTMWPPRPWKLQLIHLFPLIVLYCRDRRAQFTSLSRCQLASGDINALEKAGHRMRFQETDGYGSTNSSEPHSFSELLLSHQSLARTPLQQIFEHRSSDGPGRWLQQQYYDEYQHNRSARWSAVRRYGDLVRRVAPLSETRSGAVAARTEAVPHQDD